MNAHAMLLRVSDETGTDRFLSCILQWQAKCLQMSDKIADHPKMTIIVFYAYGLYAACDWYALGTYAEACCGC